MRLRHEFDECFLPDGHDGRCMDPLYSHLDWSKYPVEPWGKVDDNLYVGSSRDEQPNYRDFQAVLTLWERAPHCPYIEEKRWHIKDGVELPPEEELQDSVWWVRARMDVGCSVLIRCQAGLNRSSWVAGHVMTTLGWKGSDSIDRIRSVRSELALSNPYFHGDLINGIYHA